MEFFDISSNKLLFSSYLDFYDIKFKSFRRGFVSVLDLDILPAASEEDDEASPPETV